MNDQLKVTAQSVTPEQAAAWLAENHFEHQRARRPRHVEFLATEMEAGRFRRGTVIEFGVLNGKAYLVNGQHTLAALERFGRPADLVVVMQRVEDEQQLAQLYNTHDSGLSRTWADAYAALNLTAKFRMTDAEINAFGRAAPFIAGNFSLRGVREAAADRGRDTRVGAMEAYHPAARAYLDCLQPAEPTIRKALLLAPVFALGAFTVHYDHERALRFWTLAADDQNLAKTDPPKVATVLVQRLTNRRQKTMIGLGQSLAGVWNAYVLGRDIKPRFVRTPADSVRILRTPLEDEAQGALVPVIEDAEDAARNHDPKPAFDRLRELVQGPPSDHSSPPGAAAL